MRALEVHEQTSVLFEGGRVAAIGPNLAAPPDARVIEARGRALVPGLVDCHTHACWAGDRIDEWERTLAGATYLEVLEAGGGIMSTVRAVRQCSKEALADLLLVRLGRMLSCGTTTAEAKSGYGLTTHDELKMLRAIRRAASRWAGTLVPTACIGHAIEGEAEAFIERTIRETLPAVSAEFPGVAVDAYCERGAWGLEACVRLLEAAAAAGHPCRVHADQFTSLGMLDAAIERGFRSVDHLEASPPDALARLGASGTAGVVLPICGLHVDGRFADARALVDAGGWVAVATNFNPGSAPSPSLPAAMGLAVRRCGLTPAEALAAVTANAAAVLGLRDAGHLHPGARGDAVLLDDRDERGLCYSIGCAPIAAVVCAGVVAAGSER